MLLDFMTDIENVLSLLSFDTYYFFYFSQKTVSLINISGLSDVSSDTSLWSVGFAQSSGCRNRFVSIFLLVL